MSHKMVVVNEWTGVARTPTGGPMNISSSLTGWPIGFLISAGNPTPPIFTIPSFTGWPMGLLACASLAGPSYQVPPSLAGQWLLGLCFTSWPIFVIPSLAGWQMAALLCFAGWPSLSVPPLPAADDCSPVHHWLAHSDQSHPCQLASGCSACALLAGPSYQVPPLLAGQWLLGLCFAGWPIFVIPSLTGWPMAALLCFAGWPSSSVPPSPDGQ